MCYCVFSQNGVDTVAGIKRQHLSIVIIRATCRMEALFHEAFSEFEIWPCLESEWNRKFQNSLWGKILKKICFGSIKMVCFDKIITFLFYFFKCCIIIIQNKKLKQKLISQWKIETFVLKMSKRDVSTLSEIVYFQNKILAKLTWFSEAFWFWWTLHIPTGYGSIKMSLINSCYCNIAVISCS